MEVHQHHQDKLCRSALKVVAKQQGIRYQDVLRLFRACDVPVTEAFWSVIHADQPQWQGVSYCMGCRKFSLEALH